MAEIQKNPQSLTITPGSAKVRARFPRERRAALGEQRALACGQCARSVSRPMRLTRGRAACEAQRCLVQLVNCERIMVAARCLRVAPLRRDCASITPNKWLASVAGRRQRQPEMGTVMAGNFRTAQSPNLLIISRGRVWIEDDMASAAATLRQSEIVSRAMPASAAMPTWRWRPYHPAVADLSAAANRARHRQALRGTLSARSCERASEICDDNVHPRGYIG